MTIEKSIDNYTFKSINKHCVPALVLLLVSLAVNVYGNNTGFSIVLKPSPGCFMTDTIQLAIDKCAQNGKGTVVFTKGIYLSGTIELKSNVTLQLDEGSLLQGIDDYKYYRKDTFIFGRDLENISITGTGVIDGVDCNNPDGEEGFRGPHCIRLINCKQIHIKDITIKNAANYGIYCRNCSNANIERTIIRGGHDGLHTRFCENFSISGCDFRTGDDAFAGNDNRDFTVTGCSVNSSCNGFRIGCLNFTVKNCRIWGPGEYRHKIQKRNNMLTAFVHFSPQDEKSKLISGNWLIQDVIIENVDQVYNYNYEKGKWQNGQPVSDITFDNVKATGILKAFTITGSKNRLFNLTISNSSFASREGTFQDLETFEGAKFKNTSFFDAVNFGKIGLQNVIFTKKTTQPILNCCKGNTMIADHVTFNTGNNSIPFTLKKINAIKKKNLKLNDVEIPEN